MKQMELEAIVSEMDKQKAARRELMVGSTFLTTSEATDQCPLPLNTEDLLQYPHFILPRVIKDPRAKRYTYYFDPRDVRDLPRVLMQWQTATDEGREQEFVDARMRLLAERDLPVQEAA